MNNSPLEQRIEAIERITKLFKIERIIYIVVLSISFLLLCISFVMLLIEKDDKTVVLSVMFGSGGLVTVTIGGFLHMWNRSLKIIAPGLRETEN